TPRELTSRDSVEASPIAEPLVQRTIMGSRIWNRCVARRSSAVKVSSSRFVPFDFTSVRIRQGGGMLNSAEVPIIWGLFWYGGTRMRGQAKLHEKKEIGQWECRGGPAVGCRGAVQLVGCRTSSSVRSPVRDGIT